MAIDVAENVIEKAKEESDSPVAITIMGPNRRVITTFAMDGAMPISSELGVKKAYTALMTNTDTIFWEREMVSPVNFADPKISCFGGGVVVRGITGIIYGAIGVSGRKSQKEKEEQPSQDHELAQLTLAIK